MRTTIKDVAKLAGVSPSTVTRVIQNSTAISQKTKDAVQNAIKELNYHPNLMARNLVSNYTQVIGLILPEDSDVFYQNPFFPQVLRGISQVAAENGYAIQISIGSNDKQRMDNLSQLIYGKRVDGIIFLYSKTNDPLVEFAAQQNFPFLILGKALSSFVSLVDNDNIQAGFEATTYFINKGYKRIGFVAGNKELFVSQERYEGYKKALKAHNIPFDKSIVQFTSGFFLEDSRYKLPKNLSQSYVDAIVTSDTTVAESIIYHLNLNETQLPLITFDSVRPRVKVNAYVDVNAVKLGQVSVNTLLQMIANYKNDVKVCYRHVIPHTIIEL